MIHPSYTELMEAINEGAEMEDEPLVTSRYSVVLATSKRARQLIAGKRGYGSHRWKKTTFYCCGGNLQRKSKHSSRGRRNNRRTGIGCRGLPAVDAGSPFYHL